MRGRAAYGRRVHVTEGRVIAAATALAAVAIGALWRLSRSDQPRPDPVRACRDAVAEQMPVTGWPGGEIVVHQGVNATVDGRADTTSGTVAFRCVVDRDGHATVLRAS